MKVRQSTRAHRVGPTLDPFPRNSSGEDFKVSSRSSAHPPTKIDSRLLSVTPISKPLSPSP